MPYDGFLVSGEEIIFMDLVYILDLLALFIASFSLCHVYVFTEIAL